MVSFNNKSEAPKTFKLLFLDTTLGCFPTASGSEVHELDGGLCLSTAEAYGDKDLSGASGADERWGWVVEE